MEKSYSSNSYSTFVMRQDRKFEIFTDFFSSLPNLSNQWQNENTNNLSKKKSISWISILFMFTTIKWFYCQQRREIGSNKRVQKIISGQLKRHGKINLRHWCAPSKPATIFNDFWLALSTFFDEFWINECRIGE